MLCLSLTEGGDQGGMLLSPPQTLGSWTTPAPFVLLTLCEIKVGLHAAPWTSVDPICRGLEHVPSVTGQAREDRPSIVNNRGSELLLYEQCLIRDPFVCMLIVATDDHMQFAVRCENRAKRSAQFASCAGDTRSETATDRKGLVILHPSTEPLPSG